MLNEAGNHESRQITQVTGCAAHVAADADPASRTLQRRGLFYKKQNEQIKITDEQNQFATPNP
eukprot:1477153-Amphidinium_carterae.1